LFSVLVAASSTSLPCPIQKAEEDYLLLISTWTCTQLSSPRPKSNDYYNKIKL